MAPLRRSRAIWDETRRPGAPASALIRAIIYELQPIQFSTIDYSAARDNCANVLSSLWIFLTVVAPRGIMALGGFVKSLSPRGWKIFAGGLLYLGGVRYLHQALDAGPMVIIISALIAIFTIGLDNGSNNGSHNSLSAYSLFNRGFQRIMGSLDADSLVAQYVGGAMAMQGFRPEQQDREINANNDRALRRHDEGRLQREARAPVRDVARGGHDDNINWGVQQPDQAGNNQTRKSGKKARRRNLELRREMQAQRQAAAALGFAANGEGADDLGAMNRLIEEQILADFVHQQQPWNEDDDELEYMDES